MDQDLLQTALRVLNCCVAGEAPIREDAQRLRGAASEGERELPVDILAARTVEREIECARARRRAASP
jgi:hypothetical protein